MARDEIHFTTFIAAALTSGLLLLQTIMGQKMHARQFRFFSPQRGFAIALLPCIQTHMEIEGNKPDPSIFAHVVYLAAAALLVIIIAAIIILTWRSHKKTQAPYTKHPVSLLTVPDHILSSTAPSRTAAAA